jgi:hypothetical protein
LWTQRPTISPRRSARAKDRAFSISLSPSEDGYFALHRTLARSGQWPTAKGTIVMSRLKPALISMRHEAGRPERRHGPQIEYSCEANGRSYRGAQIRLRMVTMGAKSAESAIARYPVGAIVDVHYSPSNPGDAALERDTRAQYVALRAAAAFVVIALYAAGAF